MRHRFPSPDRLRARFDRYGRGILVAVVVAVAAQFLSDHYGVPAMLMALLLGIALHFLSEEERCREGVDFTARTVLRLGVALMGARVSLALMAGLGPALIAMVVLAVLLTIAFGMLGARLLGRDWRFGLLSGGAVAICGASAAMAIAAVLPRDRQSERNLIFTVLSVTLLSTLAMIAYPILSDAFALSPAMSGVFLGGTIHDVAQVVGAGFSVSEATGEVATLVKLMRVAMLAPVVLVIALLLRRSGAGAGAVPGAGRVPLLPGFVLGFLLLAGLNSAGVIPPALTQALAALSRWALLVAIAAVGIKTSLRRIVEVSGQAIVLILAETLFIAGFVLIGVKALGG